MSEQDKKEQLGKNKEVLIKIQNLTQVQAIYKEGHRGNCDSQHVTKDSTWCNQSTADILEKTGFDTSCLYKQGNPYAKGGRYNTSANQMAQNIEKYRDNWATDHANNYGKKSEPVPSFNFKNLINKNAKENVPIHPIIDYPYKEGLKECPIQKISKKEAGKLAEAGWTVLVIEERDPIGHMATLRPGAKTYNSGGELMVSNVGVKNDEMTVNVAFKGSKKVKYYYDKNQTFKPNAGFKGVGFDEKTQKQSITIYDPRYNEYDYKHYNLRKEEEAKFINSLPDFKNKEKEDNIKKLREFCGRHNITLAGEIAKHGNDLKKIFTGEITLDYYVTTRLQALEQARKKAAALEKARKEAEAAAAEKARKEAEAAAEKARKEAEASNNSNNNTASSDKDSSKSSKSDSSS